MLESNSQETWTPGLLIWPEAAIPYTGPTAEPYIEFLDDLSNQSDTAMITGLLTYDFEQQRYLNSIVGLGSADSIYHKQRLVPFGEYVPLENWLRGTMRFFDLPMSVTLSNDAWFGASIGPWQHMQIAQARALENQKPLARVTNNGITAVVNHKGEIVDALPQFKHAGLNTAIKPRAGTTPYTQYGNWPLLVLMASIFLTSIYRQRNTQAFILH